MRDTEIKTSELVIESKDFIIRIQGKGYARFYKEDKTVQFYDEDEKLRQPTTLADISVKEARTIRVNNMINHPSHYNQGIEAIEVIESHNLNFNLGNVIKYVIRAKHKGDELGDLSKAKWYLDREYETVKRASTIKD